MFIYKECKFLKKYYNINFKDRHDEVSTFLDNVYSGIERNSKYTEKSFQVAKYKEIKKEKAKDYSKARYEYNKEKISIYKKQYYIDNREKLKAKNKAYYESNKERLKKYNREKYHTKKIKLEEPDASDKEDI